MHVVYNCVSVECGLYHTLPHIDTAVLMRVVYSGVSLECG